ncbi:MAG: hypothetical protein JWM98_2120 [Thermoleophilia bacterium]|nr:hypothetical protein [Thermoleophilia bacterium]
MPMRRPRTFRSLATIATILGITSLAAVAYATQDDGSSRGPDVASLRSLAAVDGGDAAPMTATEDDLLRRALPASSSDDPNGIGEDDLTGPGRTLLATSRGERFSATRLRGGQVCWTYSAGGSPIAAACAVELGAGGVDVAGVWDDDGQTLFGLADDSVVRVQVRTNTGELQPAALGRNAYLWASGSPTRAVWADALVVSHRDGTSDTVALPDEGIATEHAPG